ncbi:hypothetical protein [Arthrobacter sp. CJ23]|uniref:hypothetical protein n=1 Tax=Arthrobacter sp. CJ23 TaxID=2972479 RepID=UPI00215CF122|nr:hypothetical protein [Arthrobacter sp. CJ23]UVJ39224.1 hypothetical protein NVV90_18795 [Arthrobacter sp. CJ23]
MPSDLTSSDEPAANHRPGIAIHKATPGLERALPLSEWAPTFRGGSLEDAATAKAELEELVDAAARPETNRLYRTVCRWWTELEVLIVTGATTGEGEANNTPANYKSVILLRSAVRTAA